MHSVEKQVRVLHVVSLLIIGLLLAAVFGVQPAQALKDQPAGESAAATQTPAAVVAEHEIPRPTIGWVQNRGQWSDRVAYRTDTGQGAAFVLSDASVVYQTNANGAPVTLTERMLGTGEIEFAAKDAAPTRVSYLYGSDPARWQKNLQSHQTLNLHNAYPGIDVALRLRDGELEKYFEVAPGAKADGIRLTAGKGHWPRIESTGELTLRSSDGDVKAVQSAPIAWQTVATAQGATQTGVAARESVEVRWHTFADGSYGFALGDYDPGRELVIDPILQLTYFGGTMDDFGAALLHSNGDPYLSGTTLSTDLPGTAGGAQANSNANQNPFPRHDLFVARFSADLKTLKQATYLGGTDDEFDSEEVEAANGDIVLMGITKSADFPGTAGGAIAAAPGTIPNANLFVTRLSEDLTTFVQSTYYGGSADETAQVLSLDSQGAVVIQGETGSDDLPNTAGGAQPARADAFPMIATEIYVVKIAADLKSISQATYFGGSDFEMAESMLLTSAGVYVSGFSTSTDLPGTAGSAQSAKAGEADAFVTLLNSDLTSIVRTTYFGGTQFESAVNVGQFGSGLYIWGITQSPDLPNTAGGAQPNYGGGTPALEVFDGFMALLDPQLGAVTQATYFGGTGVDVGNLWGSGTGNLYFSGATTSIDLPATTGAAQPNYAGGSELFGDAFVAALTPDLRSLVRATYMGGAGDESGFAMTSAAGEVYLSGLTTSSDLPGTTGGIQETYGGAGEDELGDVFIARFSADLTTLNQATYFGGAGDDSGGIRFIQGSENLYLVGDTTSSGLPGTAGSPQTDRAGGEDMVIALISADLLATGGGGGGGGEVDPSGPIFGAALPGQRVHSQGNPGVTFFATTLNSGTTPAVDCGLALATPLAATFSYQTTNAANQLSGTANTTVDIPAGGAQSYLFTITPTQSFPATEVALTYDCSNTDAALVISGVNTVNVLAVDDPAPDVIAITLTPTNDGIAHIPGATGSTAVAMATANVGASGTITVTTDTNGVDLGVSVTLCATNPVTAACLAPPASELTLDIAAGGTPTFSFFISGTTVIPLDPAVNRLNVRFFQGGAGGTQVGASSFALWTDPV